MDAPGAIVALLGIALIAALSWLVVVCQQAALERAALAASRSRVRVLERTVEARRGTVVRLAEVARAGWSAEGSITVRGTVRVKR